MTTMHRKSDFSRCKCFFFLVSLSGVSESTGLVTTHPRGVVEPRGGANFECVYCFCLYLASQGSDQQQVLLEFPSVRDNLHGSHNSVFAYTDIFALLVFWNLHNYLLFIPLLSCIYTGHTALLTAHMPSDWLD